MPSLPVVAQAGSVALCVEDFIDANRNGQIDAGEDSLPGAGVFLRQNGDIIASLTTSPEDDCFQALAPGEYTITFELPDGYEAVTATNYPVVLENEDQRLNLGAVRADQAQTGPANRICVLVFFDENTNGRRESTEALLSGIDINLLRDDLIIHTGISSANQETCFDGLQTGRYQIVIPPSPNHVMVNRRDAAVEFQDVGTQVNAPFGARPVNPLSDDATLEIEDNTIDLDQQERLLLSLLGAGIVILFMLGVGIILYGLIRA